MPKPASVVLARFVAIAIVSCCSPAFADRPISGAEAQRLLAGKLFQIQCADGTYGRGFFGTHGVVTVAYRRFNNGADTPDLRDRATVHARGHEICLAWKEFDGGGDACYAVAQKTADLFRIGSSMRWCEIKAKLQ